MSKYLFEKPLIRGMMLLCFGEVRTTKREHPRPVNTHEHPREHPVFKMA